LQLAVAESGPRTAEALFDPEPPGSIARASYEKRRIKRIIANWCYVQGRE
jgi:hypothetical protein